MNVLQSGAWAQFYYASGFNPLPSRSDRKGPFLESYAHLRDGQRIPAAWLERWPTANIQLCLGVPWRLMVVDVDGRNALQQWTQWHTLGREWPETWTVRTRRGRHYYYRIPQEVTSCPSRAIWLEVSQGKRVKDSEIRILADKALVVAPPSRHVEPPHAVYAFMHGRQPLDLPIATAPLWLINCKEFKIPTPIRKLYGLRATPAVRCASAVLYESVSDIPPDTKFELAKSWGLRVSGEPNAAGWVSCQAIDREDRNPSASLCLGTGVFWQAGQRAISFPALAVALKAAYDLPDAFRLLGIKPLETAK